MEVLHFVGQRLIALLFIYAGISNVKRISNLATVVQAKNIPFPRICVMIGMLMALAGGILLLFSAYTVYAFLLLIAFTLMATFLFHDFWNQTGDQRKVKLVNFLNNLALMGGLLMVLSH
jgi:putative oxidoreductase